MLKSRLTVKNVIQFAVFLSLLFAAFSLSFNKAYHSSVSEGISLWAATILPALFPYMFINFALSSLKITGKIFTSFSPLSVRLFNVNGNAFYALFLSLMSGYPVGAKTISDLKMKGLLGEAESVRAAALCSSSSPVFLMGSVGNITFNNPRFGLCLFLTHVLSVFAVGYTFSFYKKKEPPSSNKSKSFNDTDNVLYDGVYSSVLSVLTVGGIITVFYLFTEMLKNLGAIDVMTKAVNYLINDKNVAEGVATGFFECTKGLKIIAQSGISRYTLPVCAAVCGFGGVSVIMQSTAYLKKAKIKTAPFLLSKTVAAAINFCFGSVISALCL